MDNERRIRANVDFEVEIFCPQGQTRKGQATNISLSGVLIKTEDRLPVSTECKIRISLGLNKHVNLDLVGHVIRATDEGFAVVFDKMDVLTLEHLKKLVLYNSADPDAVVDQNKKNPGFKL